MPTTTGETLYIDMKRQHTTHTLDITIQDAENGDGEQVSGHLVLTSTDTGDQHMMQLRSTGTITPNWLLPFGGSVTTLTTATQTWIHDGDCVRDGSMVPVITLRDILGPLSGFQAEGEAWVSRSGGAPWQQFVAHAQRDSHGAVTAMTGRGFGKILLPGGSVINGHMTWEYTTTQVTLVPSTLPARCNDVLFADFPLPASWSNRRPYGGAFLAESELSLARAANELLTFLPAHGWDAQLTQRDQQSIVIQASHTHETIRLFLVSNEQSGVELTMIIVP